MAYFYNIEGKELNEIIMNVKDFYQSEGERKKYFSNYDGQYGICSVSSQKKDNICISNFKIAFKEKIRITEITCPLIAMFFNKKGYSYQQFSKNKTDFDKFENHHYGLYFINEGLSVQSIYEKDLLTEFISFHFSIDFFKELAQIYPDTLGSSFERFTNGETFCLTENTRPITYQMQQVLSQIEDANLLGNSSAMYLEAKVLELMALQFDFIKNTKSQQKKQCIKTITDREKIYQVRSILLFNLTNTPSLRELSLQVGINEKKLKQGFKEVFGTTVYGYLYQYKMHLAKRYLLDSSLLINEIAIRCGYEYVSHFSMAFKRFWGCTPGEMRR